MYDFFAELYGDISKFLKYAPEEDCCSDAENEVIADIANLKNSLKNLFVEKEFDPEARQPWCVEKWYTDDLADALNNSDIPVTEENINAFRKCVVEEDIFGDKAERNEILEMKAWELFGSSDEEEGEEDKDETSDI